MQHRCPWHARQLCMFTARGGSVAVLACLQQQGLLTSTELLSDMLNYAGYHNKLAAAKWLREQGARWPAAFKPQWSSRVLAWALDEGCTRPLY
jgi:hypothetical protein